MLLGVLMILSIPFIVHKLLHKKKQVGGSDMNIWCELDSNLLGEIMGKLCVTEQIRFHAVCNNWLAVRPITTTKSLPWYFCFDLSVPTVSNMLEFRLYEPSSSAPILASVLNISLTKLRIPSPCSYKDVSVSVMHNWLFIACASNPRSCNWRRRHFIFLSLFTKKIITLPMLESPCISNFMIMCTTNPDSPNCVFFLADASNADKVVVFTYHNGDKRWIASEFDRVVDFLPCYCRPVYIRGIMYIVSPYGQLASYNIVDGEFKFESLFVDELFRLNYRSSRNCRVFQLNGELMLIYFGSQNKDNTTSLGKQCIKMYDWSNKVWIPVSTLGDNALFVSDRFFEVTTVNREDTSINGVLSNKLYRFFDCGCLIYSIEDGELVEFKSINSNLLEDGGNNLPECNYIRDISFSDATKAVFWLDPPCVCY